MDKFIITKGKPKDNKDENKPAEDEQNSVQELDSKHKVQKISKLNDKSSDSSEEDDDSSEEDDEMPRGKGKKKLKEAAIDSDSEDDVELNEDDFIGIDTSNIIPRGRRRAAVAAMNIITAISTASADPSRSNDNDEGSEVTLRERDLRRRLNTEKIVVSGKPEGVSPVIELSKRPTKFNIVLEQLIWGIPTSAFRLILMAGVLLVLGISYGLPLLQNFLVSIQTETFKDT